MEKLPVHYRLEGKNLFQLFLLIYLFMIPYFYAGFQLQKLALTGDNSQLVWIVPVMLICLIGLIWYSYMFKGLFISGFSVDGINIDFTPRPWSFLGKIIGGLILTIITICIYFPWYIRDLTAAFAGRVSANNTYCRFEGKGGRLFVIFILSMLLPVIVFALIFSRVVDIKSMNFFEQWVYQLIILLIITPFMYLMYKWMIDYTYNQLHIRWITSFWPSVMKLAAELALTVITLGIYFPAAVVKLYNYFISQTIAGNTGENFQYRLHGEVDVTKGFLLIWGQVLLSLITLGLYAPWAMVKCTNFFLEKTWIEKQI